jgi:hypothetical protein
MYSSTFSLTSLLDGVGGQGHAPAALSPGKRPGTIVLEAEGVSGPASRYTRVCNVTYIHHKSIAFLAS